MHTRNQPHAAPSPTQQNGVHQRTSCTASQEVCFPCGCVQHVGVKLKRPQRPQPVELPVHPRIQVQRPAQNAGQQAEEDQDEQEEEKLDAVASSC